MENVRVRLVFEDRDILSKSLKSEGLKRSWILLKPQHQTISDLSSYILHIFDLHQSCPNGLLLSMDGFVLPPFEAACIIKDKDIVCVKKKGGTSSDIIKLGETTNSVEEGEVVEKQPVHTGMLLLANEEFEKETGGYQSEPEEDEEDQPEDTLHVEDSSDGNAVSKKRKASKKLQSSKKKKQRSVVPDDVEDDTHTEQIENCHHDEVLSRKSLPKKERLSDVKSKPNMASTPRSAERSNNNVKSVPIVKRNDQLQEDGKGIEDVTHVPEGNRKVPSRSSRRKKAKRQWLRGLANIAKKEVVCHSKGLLSYQKKKLQPSWKQELAKAEKEVVCHSKGLLHWKQLPEKDVHENVTEHEQPNQTRDAEDDVVPIVIRPGHIRFEPLEKDQAVQQSQVSVETFQWNGITSKKKGQKWGTEKGSSSRRNDHKDLHQEYFEMLTIEKEIPVNDPINFDKLAPLPSLPMEGDVIAYRLLELSSSWTPELTSFRVGKISWYNPESSKIMLMPVPEYPIVFKNLDEDSSAPQPDNSLYRENGSLEVDFSSLVDVRVIKHGDSDPAKAVIGLANEGPAANKNAISSVVLSHNDKKTHAPTPENGDVNLWDHFSEALNAKKAQLSQENGWGKESSGRSSWSYRSLRSSALGPTMAFLRSKNEI